MDNNTKKDIDILLSGPICLYRKRLTLDEDISWFNQNNYEILDIDTKSWNKSNIHKKLKMSLNFPDYYGENLNAFNDCLGDMYNEKYSGLLIIFRNFEQFIFEDGKTAEALLDSISKISRRWLVSGQRLICLVQSSNPDTSFNDLGGSAPFWNSSEWFNADRK